MIHAEFLKAVVHVCRNGCPDDRNPEKVRNVPDPKGSYSNLKCFACHGPMVPYSPFEESP